MRIGDGYQNTTCLFYLHFLELYVRTRSNFLPFPNFRVNNDRLDAEIGEMCGKFFL